MEEKQVNDDEPDLSKRDLEVTREITKTIRYLLICGLIGFCVWQICATIRKGLEKNMWVELACSIIGPLIPPTALAVYAFPKLWAGAKMRDQQLKKLQMQYDADRTSSGLRPNGTNPERLP